MLRDGCDESALEPTDFLCDFCLQSWAPSRALVEGHRGACLCSQCLKVAYVSLVLMKESSAAEGYTCRLCRELRDEPGWASPIDETVCVCSRCVRQSAGVLSKDPDVDFVRPTHNDHGTQPTR